MNRAEYEEMEAKRIERNLAYLDAGVVFIDLKMAYIDEGVKIGKGTVIYPCVVLEGNVEIWRELYHRTEHQDQGFHHRKRHDDPEFCDPGKQGGRRNQRWSVRISAPRTARWETTAKSGISVEIKNSKLDDGAKAAHLTYVGDSDVARR